MASNSTILGAAGEHYVMCQLLRRDLIAALAPTGVPNADIIVTDKGTSFSDQPKCWLVPSKVKKSHSKWLASPGKKRQPHKDRCNAQVSAVV